MSRRFLYIIRSAKPVVVDFYTDWCGPCKDMVPVLNRVKEEMKDSVRIIKVNVDRNPFIATKYNVRAVPTIVIFKNGEPVWSGTGVTGAGKWLNILQNVTDPE